VRDHPDVYPEARFWLVRDGDAVTAAALRTPPYTIVLARPASRDALAALVEEIDDDAPGVVGAVPEVDDFVELRGRRARLVFAQGVYRLDAVEPPPDAAGAYREATSSDLPVLVDWLAAFADEALHGQDADREEHRRAIEHRLRAAGQGFGLWEDRGEVVSMCGYGSPTPNGTRIGPVYTPPALRGRGYATSLTAVVSQRLLDAGRRFCFLYTDLANPTSNAIYERIGYRRVCDSKQFAFE
jgi:predicted GNAT family acetyltransferase